MKKWIVALILPTWFASASVCSIHLSSDYDIRGLYTAGLDNEDEIVAYAGISLLQFFELSLRGSTYDGYGIPIYLISANPEGAIKTRQRRLPESGAGHDAQIDAAAARAWKQTLHGTIDERIKRLRLRKKKVYPIEVALHNLAVRPKKEKMFSLSFEDVQKMFGNDQELKTFMASLDIPWDYTGKPHSESRRVIEKLFADLPSNGGFVLGLKKSVLTSIRSDRRDALLRQLDFWQISGLEPLGQFELDLVESMTAPTPALNDLDLQDL